jgi:outer membrane protein assembly factor BamB
MGKRAGAFVLTVGVAATVAGSGGAIAARARDAAPRPVTAPAVKPTHFAGDIRRIPRGNVIQREEKPEPRSPNDGPAGAQKGDAVVQTGAASATSPAPSTSFAGLDFAGWGAGWPPDPNGDVGPTYYVQAVNTSVGVFDKGTGSRVAAFTFNSLFSQAKTGTPCDTSNQGDPVVLYDPIGGRWIISDFAWSNFTSGAMYQCMAVSASGDPVTGGWYFYAWQTASGGAIPDYPKLGVWPDGIYMSANMFSTTGSGSFRNVQLWAFNRQEMEAGLAAHSVTFALPTVVGGVTAFSLLPSNARDATGLPPSGTPDYFASIWGSEAVRVWQFHVDWANTVNSTLGGPTNLAVANFNGGPSDVPELGGNNVDTLSYRLMMQNQYTNLGGAQSLWLTHTVGSGGLPNVAQVRWYQVGVANTGLSVAQQSTWAPDGKNRFMPSLAVDQSGDMAVGYSVSDGTMYPSIRYAGRLASDAPNTLAQGETSLIEGSGYQCCTFSDGSANTRWGDYSAMTIDPDGCTFWYTNEYYDVHPVSLLQDNWKTRIGSFRFPACGSVAPVPPTISSFAPASGSAGTSVAIRGSSFTGATSVTFNGSPATFSVASDSSLTATVPSGATSGPIAVTTPAGTATSATGFTVTAAVADLAVAYQIDVAHSGVQTDAALRPPLTRSWVVSFANPTSYPLIAAGKVFVTSSNSPSPGTTLYALDRADGHVLWSQSIAGTFSFSGAAYDAGRVFVVNYDGLLRAFDAGTGVQAWATQLPTQWAFTSPPVAGNGVVYTGGAGSGGTVYAVDELTGALLATQPVENGDHSSPALSGGSVFASYACNQAYGFAKTTLAPLWHYSTGCEGGGGKTVVYANGKVYTRDFDGNLILDAAAGTLVGSFTGPNVTALAPAVDQTSMFVLTSPGNSPTLSARNLADGSTRWTFTGDGRLDTAPIVLATPAGEFVVEGSASGMLYALDAATGNQVWSTSVGAAIPAPDEQNATQLTGLGAGQGLLAVPAGSTLSAYVAGDTTAPTITVPGTITVRTGSSGGTPVTYSVTATDPDDAATVSCSPASSSTFPVGTTTVNCTATDTAGNTSSASFQVVVVLDTTAPTVTVPATIVAKATSAGGSAVTYSVTASDPDDAATVSCSPASGSTFPVGTTTVRCTATDTAGNTTTASFIVVLSAPTADCTLTDYPVVKGALNLKSANLSGCYLPGAGLSGANATSANLVGTYLSGANLSSANLSQAQLQRSVLTNANLAKAKLNFANLTGASLTGATLTGVAWTQATCPDGTSANANGGTCIGHLG